MKKHTIYIFLIISILFSQESKNVRVMHLQSYVMSSIRLPEAYTDVQFGNSSLVEFKPAQGQNKSIILISPTSIVKSKKAVTKNVNGVRKKFIMPNKLQTNMIVYTKNYEFVFILKINHGKLDVRYIIESNEVQAAERTRRDTNRELKNKIVSDKQKFSLDSIRIRNKDLLDIKSNAKSEINSNITFAVDHVFFHENKILFKMTLVNNSEIPYQINKVDIKYNQKEGIPFYNQKETANLDLFPFNISYSNHDKIAKPDSAMQILYTIDKIGVSSKGTFQVSLIEQNGSRNFDLELPAIVGNIND